MELFPTVSIIIILLFIVVIYQGRKSNFSLQLTFQRFIKLLVKIFNYFKEVGLCMAIKFREIDWDLTRAK